MAVMSFGERLVALLRQEGVEAVFSQGDLSMKDIQMHAERAGLAVVGPRHEASGVFMAMGHYGCSGKPQVAIGATGPGAANLLPAAIAAAAEQTPVIILGASRQGPVHAAERRGRWLFAPLQPVFAQFCKYAGRIDDLAYLDEVVQAAFRHALSGTPGPVYIEYDLELNERTHDFGPLVPPERYRVLPGPAPDATVTAAADMIAAARAPLLVGGEGIHPAGAQERFRQLAHRLACPVLTTLGGSGALPENDQQVLGLLSEAGAAAIAASDLVVSVGSCLPETFYYGRLGRFAVNDAGRKWIVVDVDTEAVGINRPIDLAVIGDLNGVLGQLLAALPTDGLTPSVNLGEWRAAYEAERARLISDLPTGEPIHPGRLMAEARSAVPDDAILVVDGGLTMLHQNVFFEKRSTGFVYAANFAHLGSGLGLAVGAQLAAGRDRPVCLITGDGALGYHLMEFETAVRHALPIVVIVNDDRALGAEMAQHVNHIGHEIQVRLGAVDLATVARAMGGWGISVDRIDDLVPAIRDAFAAGVPALVQVRTDENACYESPPPYAAELRNWKNADMESRIAGPRDPEDTLGEHLDGSTG